jgi:hypothetical protein
VSLKAAYGTHRCRCDSRRVVRREVAAEFGQGDTIGT